MELARINSGLCCFFSQNLYGLDKFVQVTIVSVYCFLFTEKDGYDG